VKMMGSWVRNSGAGHGTGGSGQDDFDADTQARFRALKSDIFETPLQRRSVSVAPEGMLMPLRAPPNRSASADVAMRASFVRSEKDLRFADQVRASRFARDADFRGNAALSEFEGRRYSRPADYYVGLSEPESLEFDRRLSLAREFGEHLHGNFRPTPIQRAVTFGLADRLADYSSALPSAAFSLLKATLPGQQVRNRNKHWQEIGPNLETAKRLSDAWRHYQRWQSK
jgi:hypothetical protein